MKIQVEKLSPVEKKVTVEIEPAEVAKEIDRAYASLGRRVKLKRLPPRQGPPRACSSATSRTRSRPTWSSGSSRRASTRPPGSRSLDAVAAPRVQVGEAALGAGQALLLHRPRRGEAGHRAQGLPRARGDPEAGRRSPTPPSTPSWSGCTSPTREMVPVEGRDVAEEGDWAVIDYEGTRRGQALRRRHGRGRARPGEGRQLLRRRDGGARRGASVGETFEIDAALPGRLPRRGAGAASRPSSPSR